ncbi:MAG: hypothetical protein ACI8PQ_002248 [Planctomycetota bacterium]|jgi:hypothetical protein
MPVEVAPRSVQAMNPNEDDFARQLMFRLLCLLSIFLTACGGSSGGSDPGISNLVYTPDRFPPSEVNADTYTFVEGVLIGDVLASFDGSANAFAIDPPLAGSGRTLGFGLVIQQDGDILPVNGAPLAFAPPGFPGTTTPNERANVFVPQGTPPEGGWPWIVATTMGGYKEAAPLGLLVSTPTTGDIAWILHALLNQGFAIITTGFEPSGSVNGGIYAAPSDPSDRWNSSDPYTFQEKIVRWLIQRVVSDYSVTYGLNPLRGGSMGSSAGGAVWFSSAMGADRADATGGPQDQASTDLLFVIALRLNSWPLAFFSSTTNGAGHFVDATLGFPNPASSLGAAVQFNVQSSSNGFFLREPSTMAPTTPLFMAHDVGMFSVDFAVTSGGYPALFNTLNPAIAVHAGWHGGMLATMLRQLDAEGGTSFHSDNSDWWVGNGFENQLPPPQSSYVTGTYNGDALKSPEVRNAVIAFALRHGDLPVPNVGGLELDPVSGTISGTPSQVQGLTVHTITATGPNGSISKQINVRVVAPLK